MYNNDLVHWSLKGLKRWWAQFKLKIRFTFTKSLRSFYFNLKQDYKTNNNFCFLQCTQSPLQTMKHISKISKLSSLYDDATKTIFRSDAQRAAKQKERKEKELELCAFNAEQIEDSHHTHSLVSQFWFWTTISYLFFLFILPF